MRSLELLLPPVAQVILFGFLMWILAISVPSADFSFSGSFWLFVLFVLVGALIALAGVMEFRENRTTVDPRVPHQAESLVTTGIYRFSRNPMYLGFLMILFGWAWFLTNGLTFLVLPFFVVYMNRFQIHPEEREMKKIFGDEFVNYCSTVRRWI